jgi:hypothetical protein
LASFPLLAELLEVPLLFIRQSVGGLFAQSFGGCVLNRPICSVAALFLSDSEEWEAVALGAQPIYLRPVPVADYYVYWVLNPAHSAGVCCTALMFETVLRKKG